LLRAAVGSVSDHIFVKDTKSRFVLANVALARHMGAENPEELLGKTDFDFYPKKLAAKFSADERTIIESGRPRINREEAGMDQAGNWMWFLSTKVPLRDSKAKIVGIVGSSRDITWNKRAEEALRDSRALYYSLVESLPVNVFRKDLAAKFTFGNRLFCETLGRPLEEIVGKTDFDFFPKELAEKYRRDDKAVVETREVFEDIEEHQKPDGERIYVEVLKAPVYNSRGEVVGMQGIFWDVTEKKRAEEALRDSEALYHSLVESLPVNVFRKDLERRFTFGNKLFCETLGRPLEEIVGKTDFDFFPKELAEKYRGDDKRVIETREVFEDIEEHQTPDGERIYVEVLKAPVYNSRGEVVGMQGIFWDVTEKKRAEEKVLRQSAVLNGINAVLQETLTCETDEEVANTCLAMAQELTGSKFGFIGEVNDAGRFDTISLTDPGWGACRMAKSDAVRMIMDMEIRGIWGRVLKDERSLIVNSPSSHPDSVGTPEGHPPLTCFLGVPLKYGDRTVGMIGLANKESRYDLADQQAVEDLSGAFVEALYRKRAEEALLHQRYLLQSLMDNLPDCIYFKDTGSRFTRISRALTERFGLNDPSEALGKTDFDFFTDEHARPAFEDEQEVMKSGKALVAKEEKETWPDGRETWVSTTKMPLRDREGKIVGTFGVSRDVTDRKQAEEQLKRTAEELERSNAELEQFAYIASHDLQEPLRMVASYTQLLAKRYKSKLDSDADDFIEYVVDGASRMRVLIDDLLTYSRIGTRGRPFEPTDCEAVFERVFANLQMAIYESGAVVTHDHLPMVTADPSQLEQLLQNLISNAIKFHSEEPPRVHVSAEENATEWLFSVRDNGIGIDPEYANRIFVIFQRLHGRGEYPGTGIGLAVCNKIVQRHGGRVWVESQPGKGSTFYFTIPNAGDQ